MSRRMKALSVLAVTSLMGLGFAVAEPTLSFAGSNGQEINFCANGTDYAHVAFEGYNQNGEFLQMGAMVDLQSGQCHVVKGWYFVGQVKIDWQNSASKKFPDQTTTCLIPREYHGGTSYTCQPKAIM